MVPKIKSAFDKYFIIGSEVEDYEPNFESYLQEKYEKFLIIDTLVFPNKQTFFKTLYEPLTLIKGFGKKNSVVKIDSYPSQLLSDHYRIIIEDTAGMGKSTIVRKIFLSAIEEKIAVPFLIELRQINSKNSILGELKNQLSTKDKSITEDFISKLLDQGGFTILLDGFDEIALKDRDFVISELKSFTNQVPDNYFIMTSRPDDSLASFGDFQKCHIKPLVNKEAFNLIKRYDFYSYKAIAADLINQLKNNQQDTLEDYLTNPFLVSLLYKSYEYKKDIPIKKSQFYRQVFDALFEAHDLSKDGYLKRDKYSNLHIDDFERVLRAIGYFTAIENKVEYDKDYIINIIDNAKDELPDLSFKSSDFLKDLLETVPLFKKDGNYYKWSHKSLQDYFAAKFIWIDAKEMCSSILAKIYESNDNQRFYNLLDIYFELDPLGFENNIVLTLLSDFDSHVTKVLAVLKNVDEDKVITRAENSFGKECTVVRVDPKYLKANGKLIDDNIPFTLYQKIVPHDYGVIYMPNGHRQDFKIFVYYKFSSNIQTILRLLVAKYPKLIKPGSLDITDKDNERVDDIEIGVAYTFSNDCENIWNEKKRINIGNKLLFDGLILNYADAKLLLKKIMIQNEKKKQGRLLRW